MRTALQLTAPYGMVFQQVQSITNPAQIDLYLVHDSSDTAVVVAWLDKTKERYLAQQEQHRVAMQQAAQQSPATPVTGAGIAGNIALAERLAIESREANEKLFGGPDAPPAAPAPRPPVHNEPAPAVVATAVHDWGGLYKLGLRCKKCGVEATGFEPACE